MTRGIQYGYATPGHSSWLHNFCTAPSICMQIFIILNIIFSGDGINTTEEDIEDMAPKSKPPGRVKIP